MKVLITEFMDQRALAEFPPSFEVYYEPELVDRREELLASVIDADALIVRNRTQVDKALLQRADKLKVVGRLGVGLDNIDMTECEARSIQVFPALGANTRSVAEYVIAALMLMIRGSFFSTSAIAQGEWPRALLGKGGEVEGRTLGLLGFGTIAQAVASRARGLGLKLIAHDPWCDNQTFRSHEVSSVSLEQLLAESDILSLHIPFTPDTANFINAERIALMKPGALLINTARGEVVDLPAVGAALRSEHLGGAVLDVFEQEPPSKETLDSLRGCNNLVLTPHIAGVTAEANTRVSFMTVDKVRRALIPETIDA